MLISFVGALLCLVSNAAPEAGYKLEMVETRRIEAVLTYVIRAPKLTAKEWILVAGRAPALPGQSNVSTTLTPAGSPTEELRLHRPILEAFVPVRDSELQKGIAVRATYQALLRSRRLVSARPHEEGGRPPELTRAERLAALGPSDTFDFKNGKFQKWLDDSRLRRKKGEHDIDFARRVFLHVKGTYTYKFPTGHDGKASSTCVARHGDCGSLSAVFVSALRANGIPARALVGRWAQSKKPGDKVGDLPYYQAHTKAEFFAEGVGWVPVDQSQALDDKAVGGLAFFGNDRGDFLVQNVDFDVVVDTKRFGRKTVSHLQGILYWTTGQGSFDGSKVSEDWQVRTLTGEAKPPSTPAKR